MNRLHLSFFIMLVISCVQRCQAQKRFNQASLRQRKVCSWATRSVTVPEDISCAELLNTWICKQVLPVLHITCIKKWVHTGELCPDCEQRVDCNLLKNIVNKLWAGEQPKLRWAAHGLSAALGIAWGAEQAELSGYAATPAFAMEVGLYLTTTLFSSLIDREGFWYIFNPRQWVTCLFGLLVIALLTSTSSADLSTCVDCVVMVSNT